MEFHFASSPDYDALCAIEKRTLPEQWGSEGYRSHVQHGGVVVVAYEAGDLLGFLAAKSLGDCWELYKIAVDPIAQRRGVATGLFEKFLSVVDTPIHLEVRERNILAQHFYQRVGFVLIGQRKGYYRDGETALLFTYSSL